MERGESHMYISLKVLFSGWIKFWRQRASKPRSRISGRSLTSLRKSQDRYEMSSGPIRSSLQLVLREFYETTRVIIDLDSIEADVIGIALGAQQHKLQHGAGGIYLERG